ncbi:hypothetical protein C8F01DRAFT_319683 [Mycena amicta]|nr:hypothetical protein C8F01DRAFT_319683 [Mycena amicta]
MSISQFCSWVRNAGAGIQQTIIPDIYWWAKIPTPLSPGSLLKHQFLVSRFHYAGVEYELMLERAGKDILDPFRRAVDLATLSIAGHDESPEFYRRHKLVCALLTDTTLVPVGIEPHAAFVEFMDYKWRGPPLTLLDLARYTETINLYKPKYSLFGGNCYMFSRLVFYAVALRHYSFPFFALSGRHRIASRISTHARDFSLEYESSSTSRIFNVLYYEEFYSGALLLRRLLIILWVLFVPTSIVMYWRFVWFEDQWWSDGVQKWLDYLGGLGVVGSLGGLVLIGVSFFPILTVALDASDSPFRRIHDATRCKTKFIMQRFGT